MVGEVEISSGMGLLGKDVTDAVDEQKRKPGGFDRGEESANASKWCKPAMWSSMKLRKRVLKFTDQAAWITIVVRVAKSEYFSSERPSRGSLSLVGRQRIFDKEEGDEGYEREGFSRCRRDLLTRSWAVAGEAARTRQMIWVTVGLVRRRERRWAPRAPVAPVRICWGGR